MIWRELKGEYYHDVNLYEIQISEFVNEIVLEHTQSPFAYVKSVAAFV